MNHLAARISAVQTLVGPIVAKALVTRADVIQRRTPKIPNPVSLNSVTLAKEVCKVAYSFQGENN